MFSTIGKGLSCPFCLCSFLSILGYCTNTAVSDKGLVGEHLEGSFSKVMKRR